MRRNYTRKATVQYGIYGQGSTRLSIALGNYYSSYLKKKVAIVEVGAGGYLADLNPLDASDSLIIVGDIVGFIRKKVDYYPYMTYEHATTFPREKYDVIIWDFTKELEESHDYMNLFKLCNRKLFLGCIAKHCRREYCRIRQLFEDNMIEVESYCYLLDKEDKLWHNKTFCKNKADARVKELVMIKSYDSLTTSDVAYLSKLGC